MASKRNWRPKIKRAPPTPNGVFSYKTKRGGTGVHKTLQVQIEGIEIFQSNLNRILNSIAYEDLDDAVEDAAEVFQELQEELAPRDRSRLARDIAVAKVKESTVFVQGKSGAEWDAGPRKAFWGMFQELGTIFHPPQPFMRPAFDAGKREAIRAFTKRVLRVMKLRRAA